MKYKRVSTQSFQLLSYLYGSGTSCFDSRLAQRALPASSSGAIRELLSDMVRRGLLMRLKEGVYNVIPYEQDPDTFMPDWHSVAGHLVNGSSYYVGYYAALQVHQLITQPSLKEQIVVSRQIRPSELKVRGVPFQFIYHTAAHFFGFSPIWTGPHTQVSCSDLEKTCVDCLFKPAYAGGIVEIARALHLAQDRLRHDILLGYAQRFGSQAVIKRLGFLLELLGIDIPITSELHSFRTASYSLLDPELPKTGKYHSRWRIQQNVDTETILSAIRS